MGSDPYDRYAAASIRGSAAPETSGNVRRMTTPPLPVSIVLPTRNERDNMAPLFARLPHVSEIIVIDDSDDDTAEVAEVAALDRAEPVTVIRRLPSERAGGLSTAVAAGLDLAKGDYDLVVASRRNWESINQGLGPVRRVVSFVFGRMAMGMFARQLHGVRDPLSGFFLVRGSSIDVDRLEPTGFKILIEVLVTHPHLRATEVGFDFGRRATGESNGSPREAARFLRHLVRLRARSARSRRAWSTPPAQQR